MLARLKRGGAEARLWHTQYGFRSGYGTEDAIFIARRKLEQAHAWRGGSIMLLALDWRQAFDSVRVDGLLRALQRFGLPGQFIDVVASIYKDREFFVADSGHCSDHRPQRSGIS